MNFSSFKLPSVAAVALAAALAASPAFAAKGAAQAGLTAGGASNMIGVAPASVPVNYSFDVAGILSFDPFGDALNQVFTINIGAGSTVTGVGWDVTLFADAPSWLSELTVVFGSTATPFEVSLAPGAGDDFPGTATYSSGGVVDLVGLGFSFAVGPDGLLRLEFSESLDDYPDDFDGEWLSGNLIIQTMPVPEPGTYGLMALGLLGVAAAARRRKA